MARRSLGGNPLDAYNAKRDFEKTPEPAGRAQSSESGNIFIVQKHDASRLHWDLRLEVDGVLRSWAVTKGPSPDPDIKRLAVRTEDHPMSYANFEGTIPKGEYGGGTVMLWDRGHWAPIEGKTAKDLSEGHLHFTLSGERMRGEWLLVRLEKKSGERRENWLLRKLQDGFAQAGDVLVERALTSVLTGRSMAEIAANKPGDGPRYEEADQPFFAQMAKAPVAGAKTEKGRGPRRSAPLPKFRKPQLATLVDGVPTGNAWMHEIKFDGYRGLVAAKGSEVRIYTRTGKDWTEKFAPLVEAIAELNLPACMIDGEIVAHDENGNPDFSALQKVLKRGRGSQSKNDALSYYAFDLIDLDRDDLGKLPNVERKERLEVLLGAAKPPIHIADHLIGAGEKLLRAMCNAGQEGIIAKRIDAPYRHSRSKAWVKVKCTRRQEFVIAGWKESSAKGRPFASLLMAQYEGEKLSYKGNVGTGFSAADFDDLAAKLRRLERKTPPVDVDKVSARGVTWVTPKLVAEVAFAEFTSSGNIRHGSYLGLRTDKPAEAVQPEKVMAIAETEIVVEISNRGRVIFPDSEQTKGDLADYYEAIAPIMLPFAGERPLSLVRCPQGRAKKCFFQKHDSGAFGDAVRPIPITEKDGGSEDYLYVSDARGILQCVQMGTIEFHGWASRIEDVELPDRMVFDLDPDESLGFEEVKRAAKDLRARLSDMGLVSFALLSGGKGIHVVVPLSPHHSWARHKDFSRRFAEALSIAEPDRFTASMSKAKRKGKIFIDWLRNQRGSTAILPYSVRARTGAPVSVPVAWNELKSMQDAKPFNIGDADRLIERANSKSLAGWGFARQKLPDF